MGAGCLTLDVRRLIAMKWITPIWSDPVGWSEKVAKTKFRVCLWTVIHLCFVLFGLFAIYWLLQKVDAFQNSRALILLAVFAGAWPILFIGVGYPAMYLYAMHRLLTKLKTQEQASPDDGEHKDDSREHAA
jgi:uncharacterized membrane protein YcjF (UPF0283 family)